MKLSVVMPIYDEQATLRQVVESVLAVGLDIERLCVDDGSREILAELAKQNPQMKVYLQPRFGKPLSRLLRVQCT